MTAPRARRPGRLLLALANRLFDEPARTRVVLPAIADFQQEVLSADTRGDRVRAYLRGGAALSRLVVLSPWLPSTAGGSPTTILFGRSGGRALALLVMTLYAAIWPLFGWFVAAVLVVGCALAMALHRWHDRHPSEIAPAHPLASFHHPQINISSIPVAGDVGGMFFVVGSVLIVLLALPDLRWFALGTMLTGGALSRALVRWHASHRSAPMSVVGR